MKNEKIKWTKPVLMMTTFDDISKYVKAMAQSLGPCGVPSGCSCSTACDPLMFYWNCTGHFWIITA
jgi:hypothetical protein